jgi:hypothetical protein
MTIWPIWNAETLSSRYIASVSLQSGLEVFVYWRYFLLLRGCVDLGVVTDKVTGELIKKIVEQNRFTEIK